MILDTHDRNVDYFHGAAECGILTGGIVENYLHKYCTLLLSPKYVLLYDFAIPAFDEIVSDIAHTETVSSGWSHVSFRDNFDYVYLKIPRSRCSKSKASL